MVVKMLRNRLNKIDGFIMVCGGEFRHVVLFDNELSEKFAIKSDITDGISHNCGKIKIHSCNSLCTEKILTSHKVIILITSVVNKSKNEYYYNVFLEKGLYKDKYDAQYF